MAQEDGSRLRDALARGANAVGNTARGAWTSTQERVRAGAQSAPAWGERQLVRALGAALSVKGVSVDRERFLVHSLRRKVSHVLAAEAASSTPARAGVTQEVISKLADEEIVRETAGATVASTASGVVGGPVALGGAAVDVVQVLVHLLRIAQKLLYLHGWPHTLTLDVDEHATLPLVLLGTMAGDDEAARTLRDHLGAADSADPFLEVEHPATDVTQTLGVRVALALERQLFGNVAGRAVPLLGGITAGALTATTVRAMGRRLAAILADVPAAQEQAWVLVAVEDVREDDGYAGEVAYEVPED